MTRALSAFVACSVVLIGHTACVSHANICDVWRSKVDPSVRLQGGGIAELPSDDAAIAAIDCLLKSRGNTEPARFSGAVDDRVSQIFPDATIELAALYYISFIYEKNWNHASAVAIDGPRGVNTKATIAEAYDAYQRWFVQAKRHGIAAAREQGFAPLAGTGLHWYGQASSLDR